MMMVASRHSKIASNRGQSQMALLVARTPVATPVATLTVALAAALVATTVPERGQGVRDRQDGALPQTFSVTSMIAMTMGFQTRIASRAASPAILVLPQDVQTLGPTAHAMPPVLEHLVAHDRQAGALLLTFTVTSMIAMAMAFLTRIASRAASLAILVLPRDVWTIGPRAHARPLVLQDQRAHDRQDGALPRTFSVTPMIATAMAFQTHTARKVAALAILVLPRVAWTVGPTVHAKRARTLSIP